MTLRTLGRAAAVLVVALAQGIAWACEPAGTGPEAETPGPPAPASVRASADSLTLRWIGEASRLTASVFDAQGAAMPAARVTWRAADPSVVAVDSTGTVKAQKAGSTSVFAEAARLADTVAVLVVQIPARVEIDSAAVAFTALRDSAALRARVKDQGGAVIEGAEVRWSSADTSVAVVSAGGVVTAVRNGSTRVRAVAGEASSEATVEVKQEIVSVTLSVSSLDFSWFGEERRVTGTARDRRGHEVPSVTLDWQSGNDRIAAIGGPGRIVGVGNGTTTLTVTAGTARATVPIVVVQRPARVDVQPRHTTLTAFGQSVALTAAVLDGGGNRMTAAPIAWSSSSSSAQVVNGVVTMWTLGTVTITASTDGGLSGQATVRIEQVCVGYELYQTQTSVRVGEQVAVGMRLIDAARRFCVNGDGSTWTSRNPAIATVTTNGLVTGVAVGQTWMIGRINSHNFTDSVRVTVNPD